jgi:hypothetical protein
LFGVRGSDAKIDSYALLVAGDEFARPDLQRKAVNPSGVDLEDNIDRSLEAGVHSASLVSDRFEPVAAWETVTAMNIPGVRSEILPYSMKNVPTVTRETVISPLLILTPTPATPLIT